MTPVALAVGSPHGPQTTTTQYVILTRSSVSLTLSLTLLTKLAAHSADAAQPAKVPVVRQTSTRQGPDVNEHEHELAMRVCTTIAEIQQSGESWLKVSKNTFKTIA